MELDNIKYRCYISKEELDDKNSSNEHIIPNALGGKLKSYNLLSITENSKLGETIDIALVTAIPLPNILNIKRDRGESPMVQGKTEEGVKYNIIDATSAEQAPRRPKKYIDPSSGREVMEFPESQKGEIIRSYLKKNPNVTKEEVEQWIEPVESSNKPVIFFTNQFSVISTPDAFRAVVKIAVNYVVYIMKDYYFCNKTIDFITGIDMPLGTIQYFYGDNVGRIDDTEFSHIISFKGDYSERVLYCYIELFNLHNFIVVLNKDYDGPNMSSTYVFDIDNQCEIQRDILLEFDRSTLLNLECPAPENVEDLYAKKLDRIAQNKNLDIVRKKIDELES